MVLRPFRISLFLIALVVQCSLSSAVFGESPQSQPANFRFEVKIAKEDYPKAIAAYDPARIDPVRVAASKFPAYATLVLSVKPGSPAEQAGLAKDWRIAGLNGHEIWDHRQGLAMEDGKREVHAISPSGEKKTISFEEGVIGTTSGNAHYPEIWVLNNIPRGAWDGDMMVATVAWSAGDHELAETALHLAVNRGMPPNPVLTHFSSLIALDRGDYELARSFNAELMKKLTGVNQIPHIYAAGIRTVAACLGDFALMKTGVKECEGFNRDLLQPDVVDTWKAWKDAGAKPSLLPLTKTAAGPDLLSQCSPVVVKWMSSAHVMDFEPARDGTYIKEMHPKGYDRLSFAPPGEVRDLVWTIRFGFRKTDPTDALCSLGICLGDRQGKSDWARQARFLPFDKSVVYVNISRAANGANNVELSVGPCGEQFSSQCDLAEMSKQEFASFKGLVESKSPESKKITRHVNELSLIRSGNEGEIVLNGKSLLHVPVDSKVEDLFCILQNEGLSLIIDGMTIRKLGK